MARFNRSDLERAALALSRSAQDQRNGLFLLNDPRRLVDLLAFPGDPQAEAGDDQCSNGNDLAERDPAAPGLRIAHRPPASSKRRGAASSQLAAMRSATWSQSTLS